MKKLLEGQSKIDEAYGLKKEHIKKILIVLIFATMLVPIYPALSTLLSAEAVRQFLKILSIDRKVGAELKKIEREIDVEVG